MSSHRSHALLATFLLVAVMFPLGPASAVESSLPFEGPPAEVCSTAPRACQFPETASHEEVGSDQVDTHLGTRLRVDATMRSPDFSFTNFQLVFTRTTDLPAGGFESCTTWRFLRASAGTFRVTMAEANGVEGVAVIPEAFSRESSGTQRTTRWEDTRAFGVILTETERETGEERPSRPFESYSFQIDPESHWELRATGLSGDFTHCAHRPIVGEPHDAFTFAALPADVNEQVANFEGNGEAARVIVEFHGHVRETTSRPFP